MTPFSLGLRQFPDQVKAGETTLVSGACASGKTFALANIIRQAAQAGNKVACISFDGWTNAWMMDVAREFPRKVAFILPTTREEAKTAISEGLDKADVIVIDDIYRLAGSGEGHLNALDKLVKEVAKGVEEKGRVAFLSLNVNRHSDPNYLNPPSVEGCDSLGWNSVRTYLTPLHAQTGDPETLRRTYLVRGPVPAVTHAIIRSESSVTPVESSLPEQGPR